MIVLLALIAANLVALAFFAGRITSRAYSDGFRDAHRICHRTECMPGSCMCASIERHELRRREQ